MKKLQFQKKGFTLIEIMVAVSIFVIVAFIVTSTLLAILEAGRRANKIRLIVDNMNFALDSMTYKLKFGGEYELRNGNKILEFIDRDNNKISYCQNRKTILKCDFGGSSSWGDCSTDETRCNSIITDEINVDKLEFRQNGNMTYTDKVVILVEANAQIKEGDVVPLDFQTSVSQAQSQ